MRQNRMTLNDFYDQLVQLKNMGSIKDLLGMMPGVNSKALANANVDEKALSRTEAIILSMTPGEREDPSIINMSRKKRIAAGCGLEVVDVNRLLKQFSSMNQMMKQFSGKKGKQMRKMAKRGGLPGMGGGGFPGFM